MSQNTDLTYKHSNAMYLKTLACESQEFLVNRDLYASFHRGKAFTYAPGFVLPILPFTPFMATSLLLARSLIEFLP